MKKKLLTSLFALLTAFAVSAATYTTNLTGHGTNLIIITNGIQINSITFANSSGATLSAAVYDSKYTSLKWTNTPYTNLTSYTTNYVTTFTNFSGVIQTNTNSVLWTYSNAVAAATNDFRALTTVAVSNAVTYVWTPSTLMVAGFGLVVTNSTNVSLTVNYSTVLP